MGNKIKGAKIGNKLLSTLIIALVLMLAGCGDSGTGSDNKSNLQNIINNNLGGVESSDTFKTIIDDAELMISFSEDYGTIEADVSKLKTDKNISESQYRFNRHSRRFEVVTPEKMN